jgi:hypothetical protein
VTPTSLRKLFLGTLVLGTIDLASPAQADAPTGQYYFFDQYSVVITDNRTQLLWQRGYAGNMTFAEAQGYCASLSLPPFASGWRVPSYKELLTLVDEHPHIESFGGVPSQKAIDPYAFWGTPADNFWTSSFAGSSAFSAQGYVVTFKDGTGGRTDVTTPGYVRCVHD